MNRFVSLGTLALTFSKVSYHHHHLWTAIVKWATAKAERRKELIKFTQAAKLMKLFGKDKSPLFQLQSIIPKAYFR